MSNQHSVVNVIDIWAHLLYVEDTFDLPKKMSRFDQKNIYML